MDVKITPNSPSHGTKGRKPGSGPHFLSSGKARFMSRLLQLPGPSLQKHAGFLERKPFPKYRELHWKVPLCIIWRMSAAFERAPLLCQSQGSGQKQQRGYSEWHTHTRARTCIRPLRHTRARTSKKHCSILLHTLSSLIFLLALLSTLYIRTFQKFFKNAIFFLNIVKLNVYTTIQTGKLTLN